MVYDTQSVIMGSSKTFTLDQTKAFMMTEKDTNGDPAEGINPDTLSDGYILDNWLTTAEVCEMHSMAKQSVIEAIKHGRLVGKKIGGRYRGQWFIEPESAKDYKKGNTGPQGNKNEI